MNASLLPAAAALILAFCPACQHLESQACREAREQSLFKPEPKAVETGIASYYGGRWIGRRTANGERYQPEDITAAHRTLPFNSFVRVTNLENDKSVLVRINNRGPHIRGRVIDLSVEAAREIDLIEPGLRPVKVEVLEPVAPKEEVLDFLSSQRS